MLAELLRRNFEVVALVRRDVELKSFQTLVGDLEGVASLARPISECDHIVHCASPRSDRRESVVIDDVLGTGRLLDLWQHGNFVYMSSSSVYGIPRHAPLVESEPFDALTWYDFGKVANEVQLRLTPKNGNRRAAISLRPALVYGSGERSYDRQWLPYVYQQCLGGQSFVFESDQSLDSFGCSFIGEEDLGRAVADSLSISESGAYHVASGFATWRELVQVMNKYAGSRAGFVVRSGAQPRPGECRLPQSRTFLDTTAFTSQTGFTPKDSLDELVRRFVERARGAAGTEPAVDTSVPAERRAAVLT